MQNALKLASPLLLAALAAAPAMAQTKVPLQSFVDRTVAEVVKQSELPGAAVLVQIDGKIAAQTAIGVRAAGFPERVTINDRWHLGSDTKAFTATLIARLVEQKVMRFDETMAEAFPEIAAGMDPALRGVTIAQLLSHTAGLPTLTEEADKPGLLALIVGNKDVRAQRATVARKYLMQPPASRIGDFNYSNLGFIVAAAIAEARTGKSWERLVRDQVFSPLGIRHAGFGAPGTPHRRDQPWGHKESGGKLVAIDPADPAGDNPPVIGPAGSINISMRDWMRFAQDQLDGVNGHGKLLKTESYRLLHTPVSENYAFGWGVKNGPDGKPLVLTHSGSNGYWLADIRIMPKHNIITLVAINAGNEAASKAIVGIGKPLSDRLKPFN